MDRKTFFEKALTLAIGKGLSLFEENVLIKQLEKLPEASASPQKKQRPPGAVANEETFLKLCTGCDACMIACPVNIIMIEDLEKRFPLIYPDKDPCIHCEGHPCVQSCPSGALHALNGFELRLIQETMDF